MRKNNQNVFYDSLTYHFWNSLFQRLCLWFWLLWIFQFTGKSYCYKIMFWLFWHGLAYVIRYIVLLPIKIRTQLATITNCSVKYSNCCLMYCNYERIKWLSLALWQSKIKQSFHFRGSLRRACSLQNTITFHRIRLVLCTKKSCLCFS